MKRASSRRLANVLVVPSWLVFAASAAAQSPPDESPLAPSDWGAPPAEVSPGDGAWTVRGKKHAFTLREDDLALSVDANPATWQMLPSAPGDLLIKSGGEEFPVRIADALNQKLEPYATGYKTGVKITLQNWRRPGGGEELPLTLYLTLALEGPDEELAFDIAAEESAVAVRRLDWPAALDSRDVKHTVLSNLRGTLLPRDWPKAYHPIRSLTESGEIKASDTSQVQSNVIECWSMSWWGFQKGPAAMMVIIETPDDAAYQFSHPAGGPTVIGPRWRSSLGSLRYMRSGRMCFFAEGNYVAMAKRYRRHAKETGLFVSLQEKIARSPTTARLIGTPLMRLGILTNVKSDSRRYARGERPSDNYRLNTFDDRVAFLRDVKSRGLDRLTVVLTGWPRLGYDRQHPDVLPPALQAGGYDGMKRMAEACHDMGYVFSLHDQYRDYYIDAPSYDPQFAIHEEGDEAPPQAFPGSRFGDWKEGRIPFMDHWDGGKMSYINGRFMLGHLTKNYQGLFDHGIRPEGNYLDVFGYVPPDEDFNPEHPTTRFDCLRERARCYNWSRTRLGFVGTEAGCDWTVPYADVSSPLSVKGGIPVPLFDLVYHDAIITTYDPVDLRGLLGAGLPQIRAELPGPDRLAAVRRMARLEERLAHSELIDHRFLDPNCRREQTEFADGTTVTVDWEAGKATIRPDLAR